MLRIGIGWGRIKRTPSVRRPKLPRAFRGHFCRYHGIGGCMVESVTMGYDRHFNWVPVCETHDMREGRQ